MRVSHSVAFMQMDLLRAFLIVVEEGSLNRAAARLHLAQSSLTRQMQALEHEIGGPLLERTSLGVAPTAAGQALAARLAEALAGVDAALDHARRVVRGQRAELRIGYLLSAARRFLNPALAHLREAHPEVRLRLFDLSPGEQIAALRRGEIDVSLIGQEGGVLAREFYARKVATLPLVVALPDSHRLASSAQVSIAELRGEMFIATPEGDVPGRNRWIARLCRRAGFRPRFAHESENLSHALSLVVSEGAVALLPDHVHDLPMPGVVLRPVADAWARWDFLVVWQRGRTAPAVRALLDALTRAAGAA